VFRSFVVLAVFVAGVYAVGLFRLAWRSCVALVLG
jgi:hypothetical protein